ncbi:MAG: DUF349 domain-containing protein [Marinifilaceae bacterium]|jgi:hypothetical protein|nr:DUF349 domain-containing protein [Marinifilaceae bacterium]
MKSNDEQFKAVNDSERENLKDSSNLDQLSKEDLNDIEDKTTQEQKTVTNPNSFDYENLSEEDLNKKLIDINKEETIYEFLEEVKEIKRLYKIIYWKKVETKKEEFCADGDKEEFFNYRKDDLDNSFDELFQKLEHKKDQYFKSIQEAKELNLEKKKQIVESIASLIDNTEYSVGEAINQFRELQTKWKSIGMVPKINVKEIWEEYNRNTEKFYNYVKIANELRDFDFKKNLELKLSFCDKAEELIEREDIIEAFNELQKLHEQWKSVGSVPRESKDLIWERFKAATQIINKKYQNFHEEYRKEKKRILELKRILISEAKEIEYSNLENFKEWNVVTDKFVDLQNRWKESGYISNKEGNRLFKEFRDICDKFFNEKREFYGAVKDEYKENLIKKLNLCEKAEQLKNSTDWKNTTNKLIQLQKQWKNIGPVAKEETESVWKRFRGACDTFFDARTKYYDGVEGDYETNLDQKLKLLKEIESFELGSDSNENIKKLKEFQSSWSQIGFVPFKEKDRIQNKYTNAINKLYDNLKLDKDNAELEKFKLKIDAVVQLEDAEDKLLVERNKISNKMKQLETDVALWENNIGFFSSSDSSSSYIKNMENKIKKGKEMLLTLAEKLKIIDSIA